MVDDQQVLYAQAKAQLESAQEHLRALQSVAKDEQIKSAAAQLASAQAPTISPPRRSSATPRSAAPSAA